MAQRTYPLVITVNGYRTERLVIDDHYEEKHGRTINDGIILRLIKLLDGQVFYPVDIKPPFQYFVCDMLSLDDRFYKLVWLVNVQERYLGVINAYRRK